MPIRISEQEYRLIKRKTTRKRKRIDNEDKSPMLRTLLEMYAPELLPIIRREFRFARPRRWKADWVFLCDLSIVDNSTTPSLHGIVGVAIEIDGGQYIPGGGRHNTDSDRDKMNHYAQHGYFTLRYTPNMIESDPLGVVANIKTTLKRAGII